MNAASVNARQETLYQPTAIESSPPGIRSFVAIPLPAALQKRLGCLQQEIKQGLPELRPVAPVNLHLTLQFLGDQPRKLLKEIGRILRPIGATYAPFSVVFKGLRSFPGGQRPRVIWLEVVPPAPLLALQAALADALCELGLPGETRPYRPHLTLGRLRRPPLDISILQRLKQSDCGHLKVASMVLYRSRLTPRGAVHQPLQQVELIGRNGARS